MPGPEQGPSGRARGTRGRSRALGLIVAIVVPATVAGGLVAIGGRDDAEAPGPPPKPLSIADLSQRADRGAPRPRRRRPAAPRRISIPAAHVEATVEPVDSAGGALRIPALGRAGWFAGGPRPGEVGRAVVVGHLDDHDGPGLFADVPRLRRGTDIAVTDARGDVHDFAVVGGAEVRKDRFPTAAVYGRSRRPVLVLVTCGGPFVAGRGYRDNILLFARAS